MNIDSTHQSEYFRQNFDVSRETIEFLTEYHSMLDKWNNKINLVSNNSLQHTWERHFADSAQLWKLRPKNSAKWLDIGSGAGFPALVLAIICKDNNELVSFTLVESDKRKCAFLQNISYKLGLNVDIFDGRIDALPDQYFDVISARALATLPTLLEMSERFAKRRTVCIFPKGARYSAELADARNLWNFDSKTTQSLTDADSVILRIENFRRVKQS